MSDVERFIIQMRPVLVSVPTRSLFPAISVRQPMLFPISLPPVGVRHATSRAVEHPGFAPPLPRTPPSSRAAPQSYATMTSSGVPTSGAGREGGTALPRTPPPPSSGVPTSGAGRESSVALPRTPPRPSSGAPQLTWHPRTSRLTTLCAVRLVGEAHDNPYGAGTFVMPRPREIQRAAAFKSDGLDTRAVDAAIAQAVALQTPGCCGMCRHPSMRRQALVIGPLPRSVMPSIVSHLVVAHEFMHVDGNDTLRAAITQIVPYASEEAQSVAHGALLAMNCSDSVRLSEQALRVRLWCAARSKQSVVVTLYSDAGVDVETACGLLSAADMHIVRVTPAQPWSAAADTELFAAVEDLLCTEMQPTKEARTVKSRTVESRTVEARTVEASESRGAFAPQCGTVHASSSHKKSHGRAKNVRAPRIKLFAEVTI